MKKMFLRLVVGLLMIGYSASAQDLQQALNQLAGPAAQGYINPVSQSLLTNFNGGLFHKAPSSKLFGLDLEIGIAVMGTPFQDAGKTFSSAGQFTFNKALADDIASQIPGGNAALQSAVSNKLQSTVTDINISGPTVIGKPYDPADPSSEVIVQITTPSIDVDVNGDGVTDQTVAVAGKTAHTKLGGVPDIQKLSIVPFVAPQISIGTVVGTQLTIRYLPKISLSGFGDMSWTGFGIQHNPSYWLANPLPVDLALSFFTQTIKIDPMFEMSGTAFGVNVSKQFGMSFLNVTPYAGFALESSKFKVHYTPDAIDFAGANPPNINFEIDGENTTRLTVGLSLRLFIFNINADYDLGKYNSFTGGIFFAI